MFEYQPEVGSNDLVIIWSCLYQVIQNIQDMIVPEAANIVFMSPRLTGECLLHEPWFGASYAVQGNQSLTLVTNPLTVVTYQYSYLVH